MVMTVRRELSWYILRMCYVIYIEMNEEKNIKHFVNFGSLDSILKGVFEHESDVLLLRLKCYVC